MQGMLSLHIDILERVFHEELTGEYYWLCHSDTLMLEAQLETALWQLQ
jgi:hypothetical protein